MSSIFPTEEIVTSAGGQGDSLGSLGPGESAPQCKLISGMFAQLVQLLLGLVAVLALYIKRDLEEEPKRSYIVWSLDTSKQVIGAFAIHFENILAALILSTIRIDVEGKKGGTVAPDECAWYFINFMFDVIIGTALCWCGLILLRKASGKWGWTRLRSSGDYIAADGTGLDMWTWGAQTSCWLGIITLSKVVLTLALAWFGQEFGKLGLWLFKPWHKYPKQQLVFVMVVAPCLCNIVQFWVLDSVLMQPQADRLKILKEDAAHRKS